MRSVALVSSVLLLAFAAGACSKKQPEQPAPVSAPADDAAARARQDSIDAANRARAEAEARARAEAERAAAERARAQLAADLAALIHFDYDQAVIRPEDQAILDRKAAILAANPSLRIRIAGHCDERGSDEYNLALGNRRATAAKRYLESKGVAGSRIETVSFGEEKPLNPGHDEAAWAQNRRAEFEIIGGDAGQLVAPR